jgi:hypothetical protein
MASVARRVRRRRQLEDWKSLPWKNIQKSVYRLQKRIYQAASKNEVKCMFRPMPTIDSDGCRPLVPSHADHLFRQHGVHFFGNTGIGGRHCSDSVDGMLRNLGKHHRSNRKRRWLIFEFCGILCLQ